ncbi:MAG: N,N-dimethylformamidase beta subunit family domain-containing protein [Actinomycetes bacterium]
MIRGYVEQPSPRPGESVTVRVATDAPQFRIEVYRWGDRPVLCDSTQWLEGAEAPLHLPFQDWGRDNSGLHGDSLAAWRAYSLPLSEDLRSGVYVAVFVEGDGRGRVLSEPDRTTPDGRDAKALFVVRAPENETADVLYKLPLFTYHAYNLAGGTVYDPATQRGQWCLYNFPRSQDVPRQVPGGVCLHRPGGGTGATPYDITNFDPFARTPRQTFVHWDWRFVDWLELEGYEVDYCTDLDLHRDGRALLAPYRLMLSAGHDEYWSDEMRDAVERFVAAGGNAAFFGGNTCWWRIVFSDDVTYSRVGVWHELGRPENSMIGVSFRNGGERDRDDHPVPVGFRVQHDDHWVYEGTGLRDGDVFGGGADEYIVGYECDGASFEREAFEARGFAVADGDDGTPSSFTILAVGDTKPSGWGFGNCAATMGLFTRGDGQNQGTVFNGATTDWVRVLTSGRPTPVVRITRNVVDRLSHCVRAT